MLATIEKSSINIPNTDCFSSDNIRSMIGWNSFEHHSSDIEKLLSQLIIVREHGKRIRLKVVDVSSIGSSKSTNTAGNNPKTIFDFGRIVYEREYGTKKEWKLLGCIRHIRKRIKHKSPMSVTRYAWNGRVGWHNDDGSHHFALLAYLLLNAKRKNFWLPAIVKTVDIDRDIVKELNEYHLYIVELSAAYKIKELIGKDDVEIVNICNGAAMMAFGKTKTIDKLIIRIMDNVSDNKIINFNNFIDKILK